MLVMERARRFPPPSSLAAYSVPVAMDDRLMTDRRRATETPTRERNDSTDAHEPRPEPPSDKARTTWPPSPPPAPNARTMTHRRR
mmetsp:Transcript_53360/g.73134  ORF Transcript_53360/g.73134 Transcript_53360/m.73134 type:complete len:85 (+) Transcript_53360:112-366(+)